MKTILTILVGLLITSCSVVQKATDHTQMNPCTEGLYQDCGECMTWKAKYPREYARYAKTVEGRFSYCK